MCLKQYLTVIKQVATPMQTQQQVVLKFMKKRFYDCMMNPNCGKPTNCLVVGSFSSW